MIVSLLAGWLVVARPKSRERCCPCRADGTSPRPTLLGGRRWVMTGVAQATGLGGEEAMKRARTPDGYADAAYAVLTKPSREYTGQALLCEDVLVADGAADLSRYAHAGADAELAVDLFVDQVDPPTPG